MIFSVYRLWVNVRLSRNSLYILFLGVIGMAVICWNLPNQNDPQLSLKPWEPLPQSNSTLLDLKNFEYLIDNNMCGDGTVFLVVIIHSATDHVLNRNTIRSTWGSPGVPQLSMKTVFMLAKPQNDLQQKQLEAENRQNRDIVQGNFIDSYRNLTYKHVMALRWVAARCPQANFVMKMDDDIFVDIYQLFNFLKDQAITKMGEKSIACYFQSQMPVVRDPTSKWYVSKEEHVSDIFEDYCSGWAYVTTPVIAGELAAKTAKFPYFWVDDVHITGQVATEVGIRRIRMNQYFALETQGLLEWVKNGDGLLWNKIFAPTWGDMDLMKTAHRKAKICHRWNCYCCYSPTTPKPIVPKVLPPPTGKSIIIKLSSAHLKKNVINKQRKIYRS